jgi:hypothetical protein
MFAGFCRIVAVWTMVGASTAAVAQVIPPSELPGRERERFTTYPVTPFQPGAPIAGLPSAKPPPGTSDIKIVIRAVRIVGSTVYRPEELAQLYAEFIGRTVSLTAVYEIAKRITDKYGADGYVLSRAIIPSQDLDPAGAVVRLQVVEGYVDRVEWPPVLAQYRDFFSEYAAKIIAERPANLFTIERYLLLAGDLPGLRLRNRLIPSATHPGAATLVVEVVSRNPSTCWPARTISAAGRAGPINSWAARASRMPCASTRLHRHRCRLVPNQGAQIRRRQLPPGPQQRRPVGLRVRRLRLGPAGDARAGKHRLSDQKLDLRSRLDLSGRPHAPAQLEPDRALVPDR